MRAIESLIFTHASRSATLCSPYAVLRTAVSHIFARVNSIATLFVRACLATRSRAPHRELAPRQMNARARPPQVAETGEG